MRTDPRFGLYPEWMQRLVRESGGGATPAEGGGGQGAMLRDAMKAGARIVVGTDQPNAFDTHGSMLGYVRAGMTPLQAIQAATVTPAEALGIDAGSIEPGKLADMFLVEGNPLEDITTTRNVRRTIMNGRVYEMEDMLKGVTMTPALVTTQP